MSDTIRKGDIGTVIRCTVKEAGSALDLSGATTKQIKIQKPDGTILTKTAAFTTDGTDGQIQYTTISGDADLIGRYEIQVVITGLSGWSGASTTWSFEAESTL